MRILLILCVIVSTCFAEYSTRAVHVPALKGTVYIVTNASTPSIHTDTEFEKKEFMHRLSTVMLAQDTSNPIAGEIFDKIADDYIHFSQFLSNASIKTILQLRQRLLNYYTDMTDYFSASSRFDKFVGAFRTASTDFDQFAFTSVDFLAQPVIGAHDYPAPQLANVRTQVIKSIPPTATQDQRNDFIAFLDDLISTFPNGGNLSIYYK